MTYNPMEASSRRAPITDLNSAINEFVRKEGQNRRTFFEGVTRDGTAYVTTGPDDGVGENGIGEADRVYRLKFDQNGEFVTETLGILPGNTGPSSIDQRNSLKHCPLDPKMYYAALPEGSYVILHTPQDLVAQKRLRAILKGSFPTNRTEANRGTMIFSGDLKSDIANTCGAVEVVIPKEIYATPKTVFTVTPILQLPI